MDGNSSTPGKRFIGVTFNIDDRKRREGARNGTDQPPVVTAQNALLSQLNATLALLAANDSLTGLSNRRTLMELGR
jgi:predicted signal transduction protein with EAL and GGDEF domain